MNRDRVPGADSGVGERTDPVAPSTFDKDRVFKSEGRGRFWKDFPAGVYLGTDGWYDFYFVPGERQGAGTLKVTWNGILGCLSLPVTSEDSHHIDDLPDGPTRVALGIARDRGLV